VSICGHSIAAAPARCRYTGGCRSFGTPFAEKHSLSWAHGWHAGCVLSGMKTIVWFGAATMLLVVTSAAAPAAESRPACDPVAVAAEYDRKADEYAAAAERYRAWGRSEDMFATDRYGSGWDFAQQAARLEAAAEESRARAAKSRSREDSTAASANGCVEAHAGTDS
jgi:hypothetical protein